MPRRQPEAKTARAKHGRRKLSDEQRAELSRRARAMHKSGQLDARRDGRKGGLAKGAKSITGEIADAALRDRKAIVAALKAGLREGSAAQRTKAAETWVRLADLETQRRQREQETEAKVRSELSRDQLIEKLATGPVGQLLRERLAVDSSAEQITDADVIDAPQSA